MANIERYFAAANSGDGFYGFFGDIFDRKKFDKIYLLRGGPGTGKSTLMKKIGKRAETEGLSVHYIPCSSDIDSLDGVVIPEKSAAIFDATAPHSSEPLYPGAVDVTAELYPALDEAPLRSRREEIIAIADRAGRETSAAREYLSAAGRMKRETIHEAGYVFEAEKASRIARREASCRPVGGEEKHRFISSISKDGEKSLDTYLRLARVKIAVTDKFGLGHELLRLILAFSRERGAYCTVFPDPVTPEYPEALWFESDGTYFFIDKEGDCDCERRINIMRFISKKRLAEIRGRLRFAKKCENALTDGAIGYFARAAERHSELEKIYSSAMDFGYADGLADKIISEIFG